MPHVQWPLQLGRPCVKVVLTQMPGAHSIVRTLLGDTGAGARKSAFELLLDEHDCLLCDGNLDSPVQLSGAFVGTFPTYFVEVKIPALSFHRHIRAVAVPSLPAGFDGIACFSFLSRFTYGNFGNPDEFGLEL